MSLDLQDWPLKLTPLKLTDLPETAYLVGGAVRDALLGRQRDAVDLDVVLATGAIELARSIAGRYDAGFVVLDRERQIARVVFAQGTLDVAAQVGDSIEADLRRRDFTVNAIAYQPHRQEWVDPLEGRRDLADRSLRMVSVENLREDPLRLLRAYRISAQLNLQMEPTTAQAIAQQVPNLRFVAAERVRAELDYLLETPPGRSGTDGGQRNSAFARLAAPLARKAWGNAPGPIQGDRAITKPLARCAPQLSPAQWAIALGGGPAGLFVGVRFDDRPTGPGATQNQPG